MFLVILTAFIYIKVLFFNTQKNIFHEQNNLDAEFLKLALNSFVFPGRALKESLLDDPVYPILLDPHYDAVDRRLEIVLQVRQSNLNLS